jgi:RimJ/RimL family protein N-acetyltransferase
MQTERLLLRPFTLDDAEEFFPLASDPDVLRFTGEIPAKSVEEVRQIMSARSLNDYKVYGFGRMACIEKSSGRLIGFSGLKYLAELDEVDIGYRFLPDCWGKGYATESAKVFVDQCLREQKFNRIIGLVEPENTASSNVLKKLGLTFDRKIKPEDCASDLDLYSLTIFSK